jgi:hypothetical protein
MMHGAIPMFSGMRVTESVNAVSRKQVKFPRTKKRRLQKKWTKDIRNWETRPAIFMVSGNIVAHPALTHELMKRVAVAVL